MGDLSLEIEAELADLRGRWLDEITADPLGAFERLAELARTAGWLQAKAASTIVLDHSHRQRSYQHGIKTNRIGP